MVKKTIRRFKTLWSLVRPFWLSEQRWRALSLLIVVIILDLSLVGISVLLNKWNATFFNAIQNYDSALFIKQIWIFCGFATVYIIIAISSYGLRTKLYIDWRYWLTNHYISQYLAHQSYYRMRILSNSQFAAPVATSATSTAQNLDKTLNNTDNPDQRISEDIALFVDYCLDLSLGLLHALVTLSSFMVILWGLSGALQIPLTDSLARLWGSDHLEIKGYLAFVAIIYAGLGTWVTFKVGKPLVLLGFLKQVKEANFRFSLIRLREQSDNIALYSGEAAEKNQLKEKVSQIIDLLRKTMRRRMILSGVTTGYSQVASIFPILVIAPRYFAREITLGAMTQTAGAFNRVQDALSYFIDSFTSIADWRAVCSRLVGFQNAIKVVATWESSGESRGESRGESGSEKFVRKRTPLPLPRNLPSKSSKSSSSSTDSSAATKSSPPLVLAWSDLELYLPNGAKLQGQLNQKLYQGDRLLIVGPSGCGKSTLLRTIAGLWPFWQGEISIIAAPIETKLASLVANLASPLIISYIPQSTYMPIGSLAAAVTYPMAEKRTVAGKIPAAERKKLVAILQACRLGQFAARLEEEGDWSKILSAGEQQRIAFCRIFYHQPQIVFLDEATSALDEETELKLYQRLFEQLPNSTFLSIGHRSSLLKLHYKTIKIKNSLVI